VAQAGIVLLTPLKEDVCPSRKGSEQNAFIENSEAGLNSREGASARNVG